MYNKKKCLKLLDTLTLLLGLLFELLSLFPVKFLEIWFLFILKSNVYKWKLELKKRNCLWRRWWSNTGKNLWGKDMRTGVWEDLNLNVREVESKWFYADGILVEVMVFFNLVIDLIVRYLLKTSAVKAGCRRYGTGFLKILFREYHTPRTPYCTSYIGFN